MNGSGKKKKSAGFTLLETMMALAVLSVGVLGLAATLGTSLAYMQNSEFDFIAQQKAEEAMEAIFTAKYDNTITYVNVNNTGTTPPGVFLTGPQPILQPGPDGLVGTLADANAPVACIYMPGPDGVMGTTDDQKLSLAGFTRTITISPVANDNNIRNIQIQVSYTAGTTTRTYTMNSLISAFN